MAFTTGNDVNILQATDSAFVGAGLGDDKYILSPAGLTAGQTITITDTQGNNTLQLIGGLTIASSKVTSNQVQLTLNNGAIVNLLGADTFTFEIGGNPLTNTAGTIQTFADFVTQSLGLAEVPAAGAAPVDAPANIVVNENGTTTVDGVVPPAPATFTLTSVDSINEGEAATFTVTASAAVEADTTVTFQLIAGDAAAANQGTTKTNLNDFGAGAFNLVTKTIPAGQTSVTFDVTALADNITELTETYSVEVKVGTATLTKTVSVLDGAVGTGQTFTLTTGTDIVPGLIGSNGTTDTSGNDTFNASVVYDFTEAVTAASTLTVADQINGGTGVDTLNITVSGAQDAGVTLPAATISNVEVFNVRNTVEQTASLDASNFAGLTSLNSDRSIGVVTVTNLAVGASAGMIGNDTVTNGALNAGYVDAATAATVNISGGTKAGAITVSGIGLTSTTVNSTGAVANTVDALTLAATTTSLTIDAAAKLTTGAVTNTGAAALTTLTVKGAGAVNLSTTPLEATVKTIDASANTGGLTVTLSNAADIKVTGSKGNDVITTNAVLTTGTVDGGDGVDTLNIGTNLAHANTAALAAKYTNFETLRVNGTFDASLIGGITAIELSGITNNISKLTATQAAAVTARADIGATTLALADASGTADVVSITTGIGGTTTAAATNIGALTITGFETLNVTAAPGSTSTTGANRTTTIASFATATNLTNINLKGTAVTLGDAATVKAVTIDGTALTGNGAADPVGLTISGNLVAGSVVKGSLTAGNAFNLGTVGSSYTGGAGKDTFNASVAQLNSAGVYNTINGGDGVDTLNITGAAAVTMVDDNFKNISSIEKIVQATTGANALSVTTGGWFDAGFKAAGVDYTATVGVEVASIDMNTFTGKATISLTTGATTHATTVRTGSGDDTVTIAAASTTSGVITVATGAGNDTITVTDGTANTASDTLIINAGTGADVVTLAVTRAGSALNAVKYEVAAGDSTLAAYDKVTGFAAANGIHASDYVDFAGVGTVAGNVSGVAVTGYTGAELTYSIVSGVLTFAGSKAATLTLAEKISAVDVAISTDTNTVYFVHGTDGFLYNENAAGDSIVELTGLASVTALTATLATVTANTFAIA